MAKRLLFLLLAVPLLIAHANAFLAPLPASQKATNARKGFFPTNDAPVRDAESSPFAARAKKGGSEKEANEGSTPKKQVSGTELFFLFMNPLRNPNSIFLYMLLVLTVLGKMKENQ